MGAQSCARAITAARASAFGLVGAAALEAEHVLQEDAHDVGQAGDGVRIGGAAERHVRDVEPECALVRDHVFRVARHVQDSHAGPLGQEPGDEIGSVHVRDDDVGQDQVDPSGVRARELQGLRAGLRGDHRVAVAVEDAAGERANALGVLDQENRLRAAGRSVLDGRTDDRLGGLLDPREIDPEGGALARLAVDEHVAAALLDDPVDRGEAESGSGFALRREEGLEGAVLHVGAHADAGVADDEPHGAAVAGRRRDRQPSTVRHRVERVQDQIRQHLAECRRPAVDRRHRPQVEPQVERTIVARRALFPARPGDRDGLVDDLREVDADERLVRPQPRELLDAAHGLGAADRGRLDDAERALDQRRIGEVALHQLGVPDDRLQQVV